MSPRKLAIVTLLGLLAGCQAAGASRGDVVTAALASYDGGTVAEFATDHVDFRLVGSHPLDGKRIFLFENAPALVTTTLPAYRPAPRLYNDPQLGAAFNGLNAAMNTTPAVSRSIVTQCQIYVLATPRRGGKSLDAWTVVRSEFEGQC